MTQGDATLNTDVLIIGSGPLGSTYARILAGDGHKVTMIDAGAQLSKRPGEHLLNQNVFQHGPNLFQDVIAGHLHALSVPARSTYLEGLAPFAYWAPEKRANFENPLQDPTRNMPAAAATYAVGGMFTHWTGSAPRQYKPNRTPLIGADEWEHLLEVAEVFLNVHSDAFEAPLSEILIRRLQERLGPRLEAQYPVQYTPLGVEQRKDNPMLVRWTGADTVLGALADEPEAHQFSLLPEHRAVELVWQNGKIEHAVVQDLGNSQTVKIYADTFVIACGALLTPQLLWASGIRPDALGRYLNENSITGSKVILSRDIVEEARGLPGNTAKDDAIPIPMDWPEPMIWIPVSDGRPWHVQIHRDGRRTKYDGTVDFRLVIDLGWFGMVEPRADNRITFSDENQDRFGMPQPTFEYSLSEEDAKNAHEMEQEMLAAAEALGGFHPIAGQPHFSDKGSSLHFQSTVRMGDKPDDSVVDVDGKAWGFDNLYLGSVGVIPTKMAANPTLTASAIAIRSAYRLLGKDVPPASAFRRS